MKEDEGLVICLSGRGDKDVESINVIWKRCKMGSRKLKQHLKMVESIYSVRNGRRWWP